MDKFIWIFRWVARGSEYESQVLVEEFKREINSSIIYKLIEAKWPLRDIKK